MNEFMTPSKQEKRLSGLVKNLSESIIGDDK